MPRKISHDRLFKELITTFFFEFLQLFVPEIAADVDPHSFEFVNKELISDAADGKVYLADIVVKCRFKGSQRYFLIHIENQAYSEADFSRRMFNYFSRFIQSSGLDVYPIVLFTFDAPLRAEPDSFNVHFPNLEVLTFRFHSIQLNRLNWRDFVRRPNPIAAALMAKMKIAEGERIYVKLECLRLLATLKLNPAKSRLIYGFVNSYLNLSSEENTIFTREIEALAPEEKSPMIELTNDWIEKGKLIGKAAGKREGKREGIAEGKRQGMFELLMKIGSKKFGDPSEAVSIELGQIKETTRLEALSDRLDDAKSWQELLAN